MSQPLFRGFVSVRLCHCPHSKGEAAETLISRELDGTSAVVSDLAPESDF